MQVQLSCQIINLSKEYSMQDLKRHPSQATISRSIFGWTFKTNTIVEHWVVLI